MLKIISITALCPLPRNGFFYYITLYITSSILNFVYLAVIPAIVVVITVLAEPDSYGFHVMDKKNNETL